ncbi:hypothetical protein LCGC14_1257750 [marine sediment metagenome]|uniref:Uncharacterized protein n=1 Tax=marine sediment metagenome TaxID=412755 RepID=A0A0F9LMX2_9ZZZZ
MQIGKNGLKFIRPKFWVLINSGVLMLSLYGALTELPKLLGIVSFVVFTLSVAVWAYILLTSIKFENSRK